MRIPTCKTVFVSLLAQVFFWSLFWRVQFWGVQIWGPVSGPLKRVFMKNKKRVLLLLWLLWYLFWVPFWEPVLEQIFKSVAPGLRCWRGESLSGSFVDIL